LNGAKRNSVHGEIACPEAARRIEPLKLAAALMVICQT
jgi:hypothetical protein